jgi:alpha-glucosidase
MLLENGPLTARLIRDALDRWTSETSWPSWSFSNHDVVRARTRWGGEDASDAFAQMLMGVLLCLRGTIFIYQGEELGLPQADVPFDRLRDPEGIRFWPDSLGRDGCRTPMPWLSGAPNAGFSSAEPWLPIDSRHAALAVDRQEEDPHSTLNMVRSFLDFRRRHQALRLGSIAFLDTPEPVLAFRRVHEGESLVCAFNLSGENVEAQLPLRGRTLDYGLGGVLDGDRALLPPFGGIVISESAGER